MTSFTTVTSYSSPEPRTSERRKVSCIREIGGETLALVIPSLREAENLCEVLKSALNALGQLDLRFEILVVDDDSRDGTEAIVTAIVREDARVRLLVRRNERGLSGAILHGWQNTDADILGVIDGDGQHPAEILVDLVRSIRSEEHTSELQ